MSTKKAVNDRRPKPQKKKVAKVAETAAKPKVTARLLPLRQPRQPKAKVLPLTAAAKPRKPVPRGAATRRVPSQ